MIYPGFYLNGAIDSINAKKLEWGGSTRYWMEEHNPLVIQLAPVPAACHDSATLTNNQSA